MIEVGVLLADSPYSDDAPVINGYDLEPYIE
jgi:hypothetical protein